METQSDFKEWLALLNEVDANYVVVGGFALAHYGFPRYTGDLDVLVLPTPENAVKITEALERFGFGGMNIGVEDLLTPGTVIQLGYPPVRIDLLTSLSGVDTNEVLRDSEAGVHGDVPCRYICRRHFVVNKRSTGRPQDLADIAALGETS